MSNGSPIILVVLELSSRKVIHLQIFQDKKQIDQNKIAQSIIDAIQSNHESYPHILHSDSESILGYPFQKIIHEQYPHIYFSKNLKHDQNQSEDDSQSLFSHHNQVIEAFFSSRLAEKTMPYLILPRINLIGKTLNMSHNLFMTLYTRL